MMGGLESEKFSVRVDINQKNCYIQINDTKETVQEGIKLNNTTQININITLSLILYHYDVQKHIFVYNII